MIRKKQKCVAGVSTKAMPQATIIIRDRLTTKYLKIKSHKNCYFSLFLHCICLTFVFGPIKLVQTFYFTKNLVLIIIMPQKSRTFCLKIVQNFAAKDWVSCRKFFVQTACRKRMHGYSFPTFFCGMGWYIFYGAQYLPPLTLLDMPVRV